MKNIFIILAIFVSVVHAEEVDFSASKVQITDGNTVVFDGVRVDGFGFSVKEDALKLKFKFDLNSQSFKLDTSDIVAHQGIGVYDGQCMANDAPVTSVTTNEEGQEIESRQPFYNTNFETTYKKDEQEFIIAAGDLIEAGKKSYRFNTMHDKHFVAEFDLQLNQVMSWSVSKASKTVSYQLTGPEIINAEGAVEAGEIIDSGEITRGNSLLLGPIRVVKAGIYKLTIGVEPKQKQTSFVFKAFNGNDRILKKVVNNTRISELMEVNTLSCAKFQISLNRDETLTVPVPKTKDLVIKLVNERSKIIAQSTGSELVYTETERNNSYYLFLYSNAAKRSSYAGKVKIVLEKPEESE